MKSRGTIKYYLTFHHLGELLTYTFARYFGDQGLLHDGVFCGVGELRHDVEAESSRESEATKNAERVIEEGFSGRERCPYGTAAQVIQTLEQRVRKIQARI